MQTIGTFDSSSRDDFHDNSAEEFSLAGSLINAARETADDSRELLESDEIISMGASSVSPTAETLEPKAVEGQFTSDDLMNLVGRDSAPTTAAVTDQQTARKEFSKDDLFRKSVTGEPKPVQEALNSAFATTVATEARTNTNQEAAPEGNVGVEKAGRVIDETFPVETTTVEAHHTTAPTADIDKPIQQVEQPEPVAEASAVDQEIDQFDPRGTDLTISAYLGDMAGGSKNIHIDQALLMELQFIAKTEGISSNDLIHQVLARYRDLAMLEVYRKQQEVITERLKTSSFNKLSSSHTLTFQAPPAN